MNDRIRGGLGVGCFVFIPLLFFIFGTAWLFFSISRVVTQTTAAGVVVDIDSSTDGDGDVIYHPVIEFAADNGSTYRFIGRTGSSSRPNIGLPIDVLYDPADPQGATEKTFSNLWLFPIAFGGFGLVFLTLILMARSRQRRKAGSGALEDGEGFEMSESDMLDVDVPETIAAPRRGGPAPVGGTTVVFRRAEASLTEDGTFRYRIVAKDDAGNEYFSDLLDEDPTVAIMNSGNRLQVVEQDGGWIVDFEPDDQ